MTEEYPDTLDGQMRELRAHISELGEMVLEAAGVDVENTDADLSAGAFIDRAAAVVLAPVLGQFGALGGHYVGDQLGLTGDALFAVGAAVGLAAGAIGLVIGLRQLGFVGTDEGGTE